jgi:hypothetical protein
MFLRDPGGNSAPSLYTVDISGRFEQRVPTPGFASRSDATRMALATHLLKQWPRTSAALGFGAAAPALSVLWWSPVIFQSRNLLPFVLFIGVPGLFAAIAGCLFGKSLLDWPPNQGQELPHFVAPPSRRWHCYFLPRHVATRGHRVGAQLRPQVSAVILITQGTCVGRYGLRFTSKTVPQGCH